MVDGREGGQDSLLDEYNYLDMTSPWTFSRYPTPRLRRDKREKRKCFLAHPCRCSFTILLVDAQQVPLHDELQIVDGLVDQLRSTKVCRQRLAAHSTEETLLTRPCAFHYWDLSGLGHIGIVPLCTYSSPSTAALLRTLP